MFTARAIAAITVAGPPKLPGGYASSTDILHATLAINESDIAAVGELLRNQGTSFLARSLEAISAQENEGWNAGNARRDDLLIGRVTIRDAVLEVLRGHGILTAE